MAVPEDHGVIWTQNKLVRVKMNRSPVQNAVGRSMKAGTQQASFGFGRKNARGHALAGSVTRWNDGRRPSHRQQETGPPQANDQKVARFDGKSDKRSEHERRSKAFTGRR